MATVAAVRGGIRVVAASAAARAGGVTPGRSLAEARALLPQLTVAGANPQAERRTLERLADWCGRYTPWTALDEDDGDPNGIGGAGICLDISGCAHLFGGEQFLLNDLTAHLAGFGFTAIATVADTPGAAWAVARFAPAEDTAIVPPGEMQAALSPLPVAALRLPPAVIEALSKIGLRRIGDLLPIPRASLAARFDNRVLNRLDQALGRTRHPLSPRRPIPAMSARLTFPEPIGHGDDIARAARHLLAELCAKLAAADLGARRLELALYRTDATVARAAVGTSRPVRDPGHLERLFREKLETLDAGFGVEGMTLAATVADPLAAVQTPMGFQRAFQGEGTADLVDRLCNRLGPENVVCLTERGSHIPERSCHEVSALTRPLAPRPPSKINALGKNEKFRQPRPLILLPWPEPIEAMAAVPDGPPVIFRRHRVQHRVVAAEGPERIGPEWWLGDQGYDPERQSRIRDYYRVEDSEGQRFWIYREGLYRPDNPPRWYLHGLFP